MSYFDCGFQSSYCKYLSHLWSSSNIEMRRSSCLLDANSLEVGSHRPCQEGVHGRNEVNRVLKDAEGAPEGEGRKGTLSRGNSLDTVTMVSVASHGYLLRRKVVGHTAHDVGRGQSQKLGTRKFIQQVSQSRPYVFLKHTHAGIYPHTSHTSWMYTDMMLLMKQDINVPLSIMQLLAVYPLKYITTDLGL